MDIGVGLPNAIAGTTGAQVLEWGRRAEACGFSAVATIGAVSFPSHEELTVLAAVAAVTERVRLMTNVMIAPARSTAELAKQAATVDQLSAGRLTLGMGVGWRAADFQLTGRSFGGRGKAFDQQLADLGRAWAGEALTDDARASSPRPVNGAVPLVIGGHSQAAVRRVVQHGAGWTAGGMPPDAIAPFVEKVRSAWRDAGREGTPRIVALAYFSLGDVEEESRAKMVEYYAPMGEETANAIASGVLRTPEAIRAAVDAYRAAGVDELMLDASISDPGQVDLLADVVLG